MPFPCLTIPLRVSIVSFPFDLHSVTVFDLHIPRRSPAMPRICRSESDLSRPRQGRGRGTVWYVWISTDRPETAGGRPARVQLLLATTWSSRKVVIRSIPIAHDCLYHFQHKDCDNNLVKDNCWKEIARELHVQVKELSRRTQNCRRMEG
jgi:hypothetical protein